MRLGDVAFTPQSELSDADKARRLHAHRMIAAYIPRFGVRIEKGGASIRVDLVEKVMLDLAKRFKGRPGGYTRIVKFGPRRGDNAPMSLIEFVGEASVEAGESKSKTKATGKSSKKATATAPTESVKAE